MIYYLCSDRHPYTLGILLLNYPGPVCTRVRILTYSSVRRLAEIPPGTFIFTDFDRLSARELSDARLLWNHLKSFGNRVKLLNDPSVVPNRFELLRRLYDEGINAFNVYRISECSRVARFPVFIRQESEHRAPLTELLASRTQLESVVARLSSDFPKPNDLMVVEFANKPFKDGLFRKYGAFRVGESVYGQHCFVRSNWHIKEPERQYNAARLREHEDYIACNSHAAVLADICSCVGIDYGRIDYCVIDGRVQVFEINTNPTVLDRGPEVASPYDNQGLARMHENALLQVDCDGEGVSIPIPEVLRRRGQRLSVEAAHRASLKFSRRKHARHLRRTRIRAIKSRAKALLFSTD